MLCQRMSQLLMLFRYVESVTPVLGQLHPSAILDSLHSHCSQQIMAQHQDSGASSESSTGGATNQGDSTIVVKSVFIMTRITIVHFLMHTM